MRFSDFQTSTGTLKKMDTDGFGDQSVAASLSVRVDPDFGFEQTYTEEQEEITGRSTVIDTDPISDLQNFWDDTHYNWVLTFNDYDWKVEEGTPRHKIGSNELQHVELVVT